VPSSTSSSDARSWQRTWVATLALAAVVLGGWELYWRAHGFRPGVNNDTNLWALARSRVASRPDSVLLVGSSRLQIGIDPDAFERATRWPRPIQLAIPMGPSTPVLRSLAQDPAVVQRIVCEIHPMIFFDSFRQLDSRAESHIERYESFTPADSVEARLRILTQRSLVSSLPALFPHNLVAAWKSGLRPKHPHTTFDGDRFGRLDASKISTSPMARRVQQAVWRNWKGRPGDAAYVDRMTAQVGDLVEQIRARGGDVAFVRMPTSGATLERERDIFPRSEYWNRFASKIDAVTVHFEDYPSLRGFDSPDGEHLGQDDTPAFSDALGSVLVREIDRRERENAARVPPTPSGA
jgi:hypothetical protein